MRTLYKFVGYDKNGKQTFVELDPIDGECFVDTYRKAMARATFHKNLHPTTKEVKWWHLKK